MKVLIAYYSKSGNTEKAAKVINDILTGKGAQVTTQKIRPLKEEGIIAGSLKAISRYEVPIMNQDLDVSGYDLIIMGTPMWAASPAPAVNSYITDIIGLKGKDAALFVTSGTNYGRFAAGSMARRIQRKGGRVKGSCALASEDVSSDTALRSIAKNFVRTILI